MEADQMACISLRNVRLGSAALLCAFCLSAVSLAQEVEDLVNIDFRADVRLFTVMAALNAGGFDYEVPGHSMSFERKQLRSWVSRLDRSATQPVKAFVSALEGRQPLQTQSGFVSLALLLSGPPDFKLNVPEDALPPDVKDVAGFEELLPGFYREARLETLWEQFQPLYAAYLRRYRIVIRELIRETLDYFRIPARIVLDRHIVVTPDLLGLQEVVNARNLDRVYYIVVGPAEDPASNRVQLQHEYLHFLLDPIVEKFFASIGDNQALLDLAHEQQDLKPEYRDRLSLIVSESLIEAIQLHLNRDETAEERLATGFYRGLILMPHFSGELTRYEETQEVTLPEVVAGMFESISEGDVRDDSRQMAEVRTRIESRQAEKKAAERAKAEEVRLANERIDKLNRAGRLLAERQFEEAEVVVGQLLQADPDDGQALFYMAQIADQQGKYEQAFGYYRKTSSAPGIETWIKARSMLRMGRFLAAQEQFSEARRLFEDILKLGGDLKGAREAAQDLLSRLPPPD